MDTNGKSGVSPITFYFDFISPYAYLAACHIEEMAATFGRAVRWRPFRLGVSVVKVMGLRPLMETPLKSDYIRRDLRRLSCLYGVPLADNLVMPDPVMTGSAFYWVDKHDPALAARFAKTLFARIWAEGCLPVKTDHLQELLVECGGAHVPPLAPDAMESGRSLLSEATSDAILHGVFGSPTFAVDDELIWGVDRLWMLEHYLRYGEWTPAGDATNGPGQRFTRAPV